MFIEYFEVTYYIPNYIKPVLLVLNMVQLSITSLYFVSYYKCQYELAAFRYDKAKKEKEKEE